MGEVLEEPSLSDEELEEVLEEPSLPNEKMEEVLEEPSLSDLDEEPSFSDLDEEPSLSDLDEEPSLSAEAVGERAMLVALVPATADAEIGVEVEATPVAARVLTMPA